MDISGIVQSVFDEFDRNKGPLSVLFENHIYGLLVIHQGLSGETFTDISDLWTTVGIEYGFYENEKAVFEGSPEYRAMWTRLFQTPSCCDPVFVEALGEALFGPLCLKGAVFFASALNTGELPTSLASYADGLFLEEEEQQEQEEQEESEHIIVNVEPVEQKEKVEEVAATIRYRYTRGRVRSPIIGQRKFSRTRKMKQITQAIHKV
jgi:hypothetical protein